jgi:hypothetical protein
MLICVIFLLEFVSPALCFLPNTVQSRAFVDSIGPASDHPYFLLTTFSTQLVGPEKENECEKEIYLLHPDAIFTLTSSSPVINSDGTFQHMTTGDLHTRLFALYCDYRI